MARPIANRPARLAVGMVVVALCAPVSALAQANDVARAQQLFDEARALMKRGEYSQACARFAESQALDPGGGTILNLGICRRHEGRTATAHAILSEAFEQAKADGRTDRMATAKKHLDALEAVLSRVTVRAPATAPSTLRVEVDGEALGGAPETWTFPLDPGVHEVKASAEGHETWSVRVTLAPTADHVVVELPELKPTPPVEATPSPPAVIVTPAPAPAAPAAPAPARLPTPAATPALFPNAPPWLGYALAGGGAASVGVGAYFGVRALSLKSSSDEEYDFQKARCRTRACVEHWRDAKAAAVASNVLFGVGALGLAGGAYFLFRPRAPTETSELQWTLHALPHGAAASAAGSF